MKSCYERGFVCFFFKNDGHNVGYSGLRINFFLKFLSPFPFSRIVWVTFPLLSVNSLLFLNGGFSFIGPFS